MTSAVVIKNIYCINNCGMQKSSTQTYSKCVTGYTSGFDILMRNMSNGWNACELLLLHVKMRLCQF